MPYGLISIVRKIFPAICLMHTFLTVILEKGLQNGLKFLIFWTFKSGREYKNTLYIYKVQRGIIDNSFLGQIFGRRWSSPFSPVIAVSHRVKYSASHIKVHICRAPKKHFTYFAKYLLGKKEVGQKWKKNWHLTKFSND